MPRTFPPELLNAFTQLDPEEEPSLLDAWKHALAAFPQAAISRARSQRNQGQSCKRTATKLQCFYLDSLEIIASRVQTAGAEPLLWNCSCKAISLLG